MRMCVTRLPSIRSYRITSIFRLVEPCESRLCPGGVEGRGGRVGEVGWRSAKGGVGEGVGGRGSLLDSK